MKKSVKNTETAAAVAKATPKAVKAVEEKAEKAEKAVRVAAAKTTARKTVLKEEVYLQYLGKEISKDALMKQVKEIWTKQMKKKVGDMKTVTLYLKPEENKAYYVINNDVTGSIEL